MQESGEMYLETILVLTKEKQMVRAIDLSDRMGFAKPSVSKAIAKLKNEGYISVEANGNITLLEEGRTVAEKIFERHRVLTDMLIFLGVNNETASNDACKIEHDISDESFEAIKNYMKK